MAKLPKRALLLTAGVAWLLAFLGGLPAAGAAPQPQVEPTTPPPWWIEAFEDVTVRAGPGTQYDRVGLLIAGNSSEILGRSPAGTWLKIRYVGAPDNEGWVLREFVRVMGDAPNMPTIMPPGTPTLPPTPVPVIGDPAEADGTTTPEANANRLPTFTPPVVEARPTLLPAQGLRPTSGLPPAALITALFVLGAFGGVVSLLRRR
jgi:uncharacterized protein YraI